MEMLAAILILISFLGTQLPMRDAPKGGMILENENPAVTLTHQVTPQSEFKDRNLVRQKFDYSCGSAALATLLTYHLGEELTEHQVIQGLMQHGDVRLIEQRRAFSLLDMKRFVTALGYSGEGYTAELDDIKGLDIPAIVPIEFYGYTHFVVYKGTSQGSLFFADPFMGNISFTEAQFLNMWHRNVLFLVTTDRPTLGALRLTENDMRFITHSEIPFQRLLEPITPDIVTQQREFRESLGTYQYWERKIR
ncbi:MAG: C39 family peptidase [Desulfomonilia bacterium]|nr:C39 family peptidase [Desulfomonilia bacterium]